MREWIKAAPVAVGLPLVIAAASVKPDDAASNLAAWAQYIGVINMPDWLKNPAVDYRAIVGAVALSAVYATALWIVPALWRSGGKKQNLGVESNSAPVNSPPPDAAPIITVSSFYAQIKDKRISILFSYENVGQLPAKNIVIELTVSVGVLGASGIEVSVRQFPDDLAPGKRNDVVACPDFPMTGLMAVKGKAFGVSAKGRISFKCGSIETFEPFDFWILRKPDEDLSKKTKMVRRPDFMKA